MTSVYKCLDLLQCAIHMEYLKLRPENKAPSLQEEDSPCGWGGSTSRCEWSERIAASEGEYERRLEDTVERIAAEEPKWSITPEAKARFQEYKERLVTLKAIWHKIHRDVERRKELRNEIMIWTNVIQGIQEAQADGRVPRDNAVLNFYEHAAHAAWADPGAKDKSNPAAVSYAEAASRIYSYVLRSVGNPGALKEANDKLFAAKAEEQTM